MKWLEFTLVMVGVGLNACAQLCLKAGVRRIGHFDFAWENLLSVSGKIVSNFPILGGLLCYAVSVIVWIMALSRVEVSIAYPMLSIGYVVNAVLARWLFGEILTTQKLLGIAVIIVGVVIVARS